MENSTKPNEQQKPYRLRKEVKRLTESRDNIKAKSRVKAETIKNYQDRLQEITESRDRWKRCVKEEKQNTNQLQNELYKRNETLSRLQSERDQLFKEVQELKKNIRFGQSRKQSR